jgi:hypothetical protein
MGIPGSNIKTARRKNTLAQAAETQQVSPDARPAHSVFATTQESNSFIAFLEKQSKRRLALTGFPHPRKILPTNCGASVT